MKQNQSGNRTKATTLTPTAIAYLLRQRPISTTPVRVGSHGPVIRLVRA